MRVFLPVVTVLALFFNSQQPKNTSQQPQQSAATDKRGTQEVPVFVKVLPTQKTQEETEQETQDRDKKTSNDRNLVYLTGILAGVGFLQLLVFAYQAHKLRQTVRSAGEQSDAMERHIGEAARSATAMEGIATAIQTGNREVMRAYLTVVIGSAIYQERREGQSDLKFEARPHLVNTGNTPARKVHFRIQADILPVPIPDDFGFPLPEEPMKSAGGGTVGAHHTNIMGGTVKDFVPDAEVAAIKEGTQRALCVWGLVSYEDIFGDAHTTKFGQLLTWLPNNTLFGYYLLGQNDGD
jgi:hypothetical protein